jgi:hypothetical protein
MEVFNEQMPWMEVLAVSFSRTERNLRVVAAPGKAGRDAGRSWNPVKWLMSRDPAALNNLGLALLAAGVLIAVTAWAARFTSTAVPRWPVMAGIVMAALGLALALATIGARREAKPGSPAGNARQSGSSRSAAQGDEAKADGSAQTAEQDAGQSGSSQSAAQGDEAKADGSAQTAEKYGVYVRGDVIGQSVGDKQIVTMNFGTSGKPAPDNKHTGAEPTVNDGE